MTLIAAFKGSRERPRLRRNDTIQVEKDLEGIIAWKLIGRIEKLEIILQCRKK